MAEVITLVEHEAIPIVRSREGKQKNWDKNTPSSSKNSKKNFRQRHGTGETGK